MAPARSGPWSATSPAPLRRLPAAATRLLTAWADLDRFEAPDVPMRGGDYHHVDAFPAHEPAVWPPATVKAPGSGSQVRCTQVLVGCIPVPEVEDALDRVFGDLRLQAHGLKPRRGGASVPAHTCRASFLLDETGRPLPDSFDHAVLLDFVRHVEHEVRGGRGVDDVVRTGLGKLDVFQQELRERWGKAIEGSRASSPFAAVQQCLAAVEAGGSRNHRVSVTWIERDSEPPRLLPAFFHDDLEAAATGPTSALLHHYLQGDQASAPPGAVDVRAGEHPAVDLLDPALLPRAAWPSEHLPRLSQQIALTALLNGQAPVSGVNGPPGTGKTTFLRDVYANVITDRAGVLVTCADPAAAFGKGRTVDLGGTETGYCYAPPADARGFEMLVASSNNAAVENVTREIPDLEALGKTHRENTTYFRTVTGAETVQKTVKKKGAVASTLDRAPEEVTRPGLLPEGKQAWGLGAAALGSRDRVGAFQQVLDPYTGDSTPWHHLFAELTRPGPLTWQQARRNFHDRRRAVDEAIEQLQRTRQEVTRLPLLQSARDEAARTVEAHRGDLAAARTAVTTLANAADRADTGLSEARARLTESAAGRPGRLARTFGSGAARAWQRERDAAVTAEETASRAADGAHRALDEAREEETSVRTLLGVSIDALAAAQTRLAQAQTAAGALDPERHVDDERWWRRSVEDRELGTAWVDESLQRLRIELFQAALAVHEAFARAAHKQVRGNLRLWFALQNGKVADHEIPAVAPDVWASLFLVVPLVSTTFASVARLLQHVPSGSLGWLIVDEAGQATPGAAVGAMGRFRRAVVVGDPQQLEPVVTLPRQLIRQLMTTRGADLDFSPHRTSVQRLADAVTTRGTTRLGKWIGLPLIVHNRCDDVMFSIANRMAYQDAMIQGRTRPVRDDAAALGPSCWIDVVGPVDGHVGAQDWAAVRSILDRIDWTAPADEEHPPLSVAVISPFRDAVAQLSTRVPAHLKALLPRDWSAERVKKTLARVEVGTVHTFQGKEHDVVLLVLGGGSAGARSWAAETPNLLNVAVTRAKDRLFVIASYENWRGAGHAGTLASMLPRVPFTPV
ncbi:DEAD/DEAH box helicase [Kineococcus rhizosphaerae]|nr:ATP-binding protein [Kineococcus rhizosphaerae]